MKSRPGWRMRLIIEIRDHLSIPLRTSLFSSATVAASVRGQSLDRDPPEIEETCDIAVGVPTLIALLIVPFNG